MSSMRKISNEEKEIINQNTHNSMGSFSKKSTFRQMTKPLLNNKSSLIPRLNELLNDHIFQYYFRTHFNSKEYNKFKYFSENEKINVMIDLYFYIMNKANNDYIEEEQINESDIDNNDNENNGIDKLLDNLLLLDSNQSRMNVLEKMKEYKLFSLYDENNYNDRFNKILNKYKNGINNDNNGETINYYYNKANNPGDNNINTKINNGSFSNLNYNSKPFSTSKFNIKTINNNAEFSPVKYKTQQMMNLNNIQVDSNNNEETKMNNENDNNNNNIYNEIIGPYKKDNIYEKINISNIKMIKMGKIRKKKINIDENNDNNNHYLEYLLYPKEYEIKSKKNDIEEKETKNYLYNDQFKTPVNYRILKPKVNSKTKSNISPYIYNNNEINEIIVQEPIVICQSNLDNCKMNLLLKKQINENETNDLIKKIYQFDGDNISFNKNEINKIGILLINYIKLEKKYNVIETTLFIYKDKISKMKQLMQLLTKKSMERINDSNIFIREQKLN